MRGGNCVKTEAAHRPSRGLRCLSAVYSGITGIRNVLYDKSITREITVSRPVVSVGNLSAGGTGKTPLVIKLAGSFLQLGLQPAVVSRGYGGIKGRHPELVPPDADFRDYGDEPVLMARVLPQVPVVVSRDRVMGANWIIHHADADCLILDDGFQHRRIARDCNIVLLDARFPFTRDRLLPAGRLRENINGLKRADIIVFTHSDSAPPAQEDLEWIQSLPVPPPVFLSRHVPAGIRHVWTDQPAPVNPEQASIALISSIGSPSGFRKTAEQAGLSIQHEKHFRDHKALTAEEWYHEINVAGRRGCSHVVITAKDESRYPKNLVPALPVCVLDMTMEINKENAFISRVTSRIKINE
jgi:tetraacyldisaccharide 4'-kinase